MKRMLREPMKLPCRYVPAVVKLTATLIVLSIFSASCTKPSPAVNTAAAPSPAPTNFASADPSPIIGKPYPAVGVVKLINRKEGWIEINHEAIEGLMPAMEMEWSVEKGSLLDNVKVGDKVNFTVVETGKGELITSLQKATK
jgi:Cu/Ag efflux protein CusF